MWSNLKVRVLRSGKVLLLEAQRMLHRTHRPVRPLRPASQVASGVAADASTVTVDVTSFELGLSEWQRTLPCVRCPSSGRVR